MKTGLVLSGGGARGIAHAGVLKALDELDIKIDAISGVSSGAIIGAFYASGIRPDNILKIAADANLFDLMDFRLGKQGFFKSEAIRRTLEKNIKKNSFESLRIPLTVAATDFINGKTDYFSSGNLINSLLASAAIPVIFQPVIMDSNVYVDGGLLNNLPVEPLLFGCEIIIGVHVNPLNKSIKDFSIRTAIERSFHMAIAHTIYSKKEKCSVFIEPRELYRFRAFDMKHTREIFEIGYEAAMEQKEKIRSLHNV
jgi:NTE family protein